MNSDGPKILIIAAKIPYLNSTNSDVVAELAGRSNCFVAGYGHAINSSSVADIIRRYGRFDLVFAEPWALLDRASPILEPFRPLDLFDHDIPIIMNALQYDMHILDEESLIRYRRLGIKIVSTVCSPQFWQQRFEEKKYLNVEPIGALCVDPSLVTDDFIMLPHCLAGSEFHFHSFNRRSVDVAVPGVKYSFRSAVSSLLEEGRISKASTRPDILQRIILQLLQGDQLGRRHFLRGLAKKRFQRAIADARVSITCDASIGYAVRKFFEVPALGSVLAAKFFPSYRDLGFIHGQTALVMDGPEDVFEVLRFLHDDPSAMEKIARQGQEMVREFHMVRRRVDQFIEFASAVSCQRNVTTRWQNGKQILVDMLKPLN